MTFVSNILSSNAIQLILTFALGASLCMFPVRKIIVALGVFIAAGVILSFFFLIGEVYIYSESYRRAFLFFGDNITTILGFVFLYSIAANLNVVALLAVTGVIMSGGKASIILLLLMIGIYLTVQRRMPERKMDAIRIASLLALGVSAYIILQSLSLSLMNTSGFAAARGTIIEAVTAVREFPAVRKDAGTGEANSGDDEIPRVGNACASASLCLQTQFASPLSQRYYTSLAGLWMTLQGGFSGSSFPSTPESFADLMVTANPWRINERYGLTWDDWKRMGSVQNPYMNFGAGYGPWALMVLITVLFSIAYLAAENLWRGQPNTSAAFSIFFIVTVLANWTQSWLMSGSYILVLLGLCACRILIDWVLRRGLMRMSRSVLQRLAAQ